MRKIFCAVIIICSFFGRESQAQPNDISFLVKNIKDNYAGYAEKVKGKTFDLFVEKTIRDNGTDTFRIISAIADYFHDPHLKVYGYRNITMDTLKFQKNLIEVQKYLSSAGITRDKYEGYWVNDYNTNVIALKKVNLKPWVYQGYVMETRNNVLPPGMACMSMEFKKGNTYLTDYTGSMSGTKVYTITEFRNDSIFTTGPLGKWHKLNAYTGPILKALPAANFEVTGRLLDSSNYLITMPGNSEENTVIADSLIKAQYKIIGSTKNLIIDIRGNTGGTIRTYKPIFPFVYTQPIKPITGLKYYTNALYVAEQIELDDIKKQTPWNAKLIAHKQKFVDSTKANIGSVSYWDYQPVPFDSVKQYPENVAIITNYACMSAAEMMLLDFKQSKKVTVFGEHTFGAIDYLDDFATDFPSGKYLLSNASVKRAIPKGGTKLDYKGIYPDVPISDSEKDWIAFVKRHYEGKK